MTRERCIDQLNMAQREIQKFEYYAECEPDYPNMQINERINLGFKADNLTWDDYQDIENFIKAVIKARQVEEIRRLKEYQVSLRSRLKEIL